MIKLPAKADGQWLSVHNSDKLPDLSVTKNLNFDKEGYIKLSKPVISFYSEVDDADFGVPVGFGQVSVGQYFVVTEESQFKLDMAGGSFTYGLMTVTQDSNVDTPVNSNSNTPDAVFFNDDFVYANPTDRKMYKNSLGSFLNDWTISDTSATLESSRPLSICNFLSNTSLAVGNDNNVDQYNTSYTAGTALVIPDDFLVTGLAYNNGYLGITTHHKSNSQRSAFFVWDGKTSAANYVTEVPSVTSYSPVGYRGSFVFLSGNGILYYWTPTQITPIAALPTYYDDATFAVGSSSNNKNHSIITDGELIHINIKSFTSDSSEYKDHYNHKQSGGLWTYDPAVGLYHRHAPSGTRVLVDTIATSSVNTGTDSITVTTAPETGTPVRYSDGTGTAITGLTNRQVYYTIKVDATTVQLAETYTDAINGTEIDLTGTGNNNQTLQFYRKTDFGQQFITGQQGAVYLESTKTQDLDLYYKNFLFGSECAITTTTEYDVGCMVIQDTENRGYLVTAKYMSQGLQDEWNKIFIKHSPLLTDLDKIVIKYRITNNNPLVRIKELATDGVITWSDNNTFTTTDPQFGNVLEGDEIEIIQGAGSGYLAHVSSISESTGTYTVNIDETIKNITASDTARAIASRWTKLTTLNNGIISNEDGYSEILLGIKSKQLQLKIELRGEDIEIEEILIANRLHKPVA